jgi:SAM-dependent methyltransferase
MVFSDEWNTRYQENTHMSVWPWSDVVSYVMRYGRPLNPSYKILELGCGAGANIPFFENLNVQYFALEGSKFIVNMLKEKFPHLSTNILEGDFTKQIPFKDLFKLVLDRASLTHNCTEDINRSLNLIYSVLEPGGIFIGIDWFSTVHSDYLNGSEAEDAFTRKGYTEGQFANVGRVHFSDKEHLLKLFDKFKIISLEEKVIKKEFPEENHIFSSWNIVAKKAER